MTEKQFALHWDYYLTIEQDLFQSKRFVEHANFNFSAYSSEFAKILLLAASEVDVVIKVLCNALAPEKKPKRIDQYANILLGRIPAIVTFEIMVNRIKLCPWGGWRIENDGSPIWWKACNNTKHDRGAKFTEANLLNATLAVGALRIILMLLYDYLEDDAKNAIKPQMLHTYIQPIGNG
jgi:hypothetical protein